MVCIVAEGGSDPRPLRYLIWSVLQAYLEKYPEGEFKSLAQVRLSDLRTALNS
jgi:hypothetical protein